MSNPARWATCRIGSCQRHQDCMYTPCRGGETDAEALDRITAAAVAKVASWPEWKRDSLRAQVEALGKPQWRQDKPQGRW